MEEDKFEKQVRQKMDELELNPSEDVWQHVKNRIEKRKNRKPGLLIFFFLLALLLSGGYWLFNHTNNSISKEDLIGKNSKEQSRDSLIKHENNTNTIIQIDKTKDLTSPESPLFNTIEKTSDANQTAVKKSPGNIVKTKITKVQRLGNTTATVISLTPQSFDLPVKNNNEVKLNEVLHERQDRNANNMADQNFRKENLTIDTFKNTVSPEKDISKKLPKQQDTLARNSGKKSPNLET